MSGPALSSRFDDVTGTTRLRLSGTLSASIEIDIETVERLDSRAHDAIARSLEDLARLHRTRAEQWREIEHRRKQQCETCRWLGPTDGGGKIDPEECGVCNDPNLPEWAAEMLADASTGGWAIRRKSDGKTCKHWETKG